jgi:HD-like signal output (HDOD) protein/CheY-like chemotaxis protein
MPVCQTTVCTKSVSPGKGYGRAVSEAERARRNDRRLSPEESTNPDHSFDAARVTSRASDMTRAIHLKHSLFATEVSRANRTVRVRIRTRRPLAIHGFVTVSMGAVLSENEVLSGPSTGGRHTPAESSGHPLAAMQDRSLAPAAPACSPDRWHVLFVDDEPHVLHGLRRMLRSVSDSWRLSFASSAAEALRVMQADRVDAIVSDMAMPDMNGAQLLSRVQASSPSTARIILSGQTDPDTVLDVVRSAQQFLAKPCDSLELTTAVSRALAVQSFLNDPSLRDLIGGVNALPTLPAVYDQLVTAVGRQDVRMSDVARIISSDVATSTEMLKLVNSAFFGLPRQIYSIEAAVRMLGLDNIQALVLTSSLFHVNDALAWVLDVEDLRTQSMSRAGIARSIANLEGWAGPERDIAVLSCMLRDVGRLVLAEGRPDVAQQLQLNIDHDPCPVSPVRLAELESSAFGCTSAQASAYLLGLWGFSSAVVRTVAVFPLTTMDRSATRFDRVLDFASARSGRTHEQYAVQMDGYMTQERARAWNLAADHVLHESVPEAASAETVVQQGGRP